MRRLGSSAIALALLALGLAGLAATADAVVIELKSGRRVEGTLREANSARVTLDADGQTVAFETADVRAIYFAEPGPAAFAPPPPQPRGPDALEVLKALRTALVIGTSAREFSPRVGEARAVVDRYLGSIPGGMPAGGPALRDAMRYYQASEFAWRNHSVASSTVWIKREDVLEQCASYRDFAQQMQARGEPYYSERTRSFLVISDGVLPVLWSCAADRIDEAEQSLPLTARPAPPAR